MNATNSASATAGKSSVQTRFEGVGFALSVLQANGGGGIAMPFYDRGPVRMHYEEVGSGFPLLLIPGGGLNSALSSWQTASPFNPMQRYNDASPCTSADL